MQAHDAGQQGLSRARKCGQTVHAAAVERVGYHESVSARSGCAGRIQDPHSVTQEDGALL